MGQYDNDTKIKVAISVAYDRKERERIGRAIIAHIIARTQRGLDVNNVKFNSYSVNYTQSLKFELSGKTNLVNLKLTGNMLNSLRIIDSSVEGFIVIGIDNSTQPQAFNHQTGDTLPKRKFIGINKDELAKILADNPPKKLKEFNPENTRFVKLDDKNYVSYKVNLGELLNNVDKENMNINSEADIKRINAIKDTLIQKNEMDMPRIKAQSGELKIADGIHRLLAFEQLWYKEIYIQVPKENITEVIGILNGKVSLDKIKDIIKDKASNPKKNSSLSPSEQKLLNDMLKKQGLKK